MVGIVVNAGEDITLKAALIHTAGQNLRLKLFATDDTPAETDTTGTYTEAVGGGYADILLTGASWTVTPGAPTSAAYAQQTYTFTGALTTNGTIYGYFLTQTTSGTLYAAEAGAALQFTPANNGDTYKVTPTITAE